MKYAIDNGILDLEKIQENVSMQKRSRILAKHPYTIWYSESMKRWYTYIPDPKRGRKQISNMTEKGLQDAIVKYWRDQESPTFEAVFNEWSERKLNSGKIARNTYDRYREVYNRHCTEFGEKRLQNITDLDIIDFIEDEVVRCNLNAKGLQNLKTIIRGSMKRAFLRRLTPIIIDNVLSSIDVSDLCLNQSRKYAEEEVFNDEEVDLLFEYISRHEDMINLGIVFLFCTGLRVGELVALNKSDVDGNIVSVTKTERRERIGTGKKYRYYIIDHPKSKAGFRDVVIADRNLKVVEKIFERSDNTEFLFSVNGKRLTSERIRDRLRTICNKIGIVAKSPHKARKTYGSILLDNNVDKQLIISLMGHTNIETTELYYHKDRKNLEQKKKIINSLPPLGNFY